MTDVPLPWHRNYQNGNGELVEVTIESIDVAALARFAARPDLGRRPGGHRSKLLGGSIVVKTVVRDGVR